MRGSEGVLQCRGGGQFHPGRTQKPKRGNIYLRSALSLEAGFADWRPLGDLSVDDTLSGLVVLSDGLADRGLDALGFLRSSTGWAWAGAG